MHQTHLRIPKTNETTLPLKPCQTRHWIHGELFQSSLCLDERRPLFSGADPPPLHSKTLALNASLQGLSPPVPESGWIAPHGCWILWHRHTLWIERQCPSRLQTWERTVCQKNTICDQRDALKFRSLETPGSNNFKGRCGQSQFPKIRAVADAYRKEVETRWI